MILRLTLSRLALGLLTLLVVSAFIFLASEILPGDIAARVLGRDATEQARQVFRERLRLDRPVIERYGLWLSGVVRGDFGTSLVNGRPVVDAVLPRMRNTFILGAYAFALYVPVTLILSTISALYRNKAPDNIVSFFT